MSCGPGPSPLDPIASWLDDNYESYWVPSENMFPTLLVGDYFMVRKRGRDVGPLARGSLVAFVAGRADNGSKCPLDRCEQEVLREAYISRIVGTPGEVVSVASGHLLVNGDSVVEREQAAKVMTTDGTGRTVSIHVEKLGDRDYEVAVESGRAFRSFGPFVVEEGRYFLLGDFRTNSLDSRVLGTVRAEDVLGTVALIYWSKEPGGAVRWERIGDQPR